MKCVDGHVAYLGKEHFGIIRESALPIIVRQRDSLSYRSRCFLKLRKLPFARRASYIFTNFLCDKRYTQSAIVIVTIGSSFTHGIQRHTMNNECFDILLITKSDFLLLFVFSAPFSLSTRRETRRPVKRGCAIGCASTGAHSRRACGEVTLLSKLVQLDASTVITIVHKMIGDVR